MKSGTKSRYDRANIGNGGGVVDRTQPKPKFHSASGGGGGGGGSKGGAALAGRSPQESRARARLPSFLPSDRAATLKVATGAAAAAAARVVQLVACLSPKRGRVPLSHFHFHFGIS